MGRRARGGGSVSAQTEEVETVTRNMTVKVSFKLVDSGNGKVWEYFSPRTYSATEKTKASPIFGSSSTEADLTPADKIIGSLVERGAREFVSMLMPCRIDVEAEIESSGNANCAQGVRYLRGVLSRGPRCVPGGVGGEPQRPSGGVRSGPRWRGDGQP